MEAIVPYKVTWRTNPGRKEVHSAIFSDLEDARTEAQLFSLSIPGSVETTVDDEDGRQLDIFVRDNDA